VDELEKDLLKKAMQKANGVATKAAKLLGMSYKTFWYRWEKLNIQSSKGYPSLKGETDAPRIYCFTGFDFWHIPC
jgi:hypothetical protein